jgi:hypothetical protein
MERKRNSYKFLLWRPEDRTALSLHRHELKDVKNVKDVPVHYWKAHRRAGVITHLVCRLDIRRQDRNLRLSRFTPGKERQYLLYMKLGGYKCRSGRFGEEKNLLPLPRFEPRIFQPIVIYDVYAIQVYFKI